MKKPSNILIILLDGCPAHRISLYGGRKGVTPVMDSLSDRAYILRNNYTTSYCTIPSYTSMMTGLYPFIHKACGTYSYYDGARKMLPELFKDSGYQTFCIFNNVVSISPETGIISGYERFYRVGKREDWFRATTEEKRGIKKPSFKRRFFQKISSTLKKVSPEKEDALSAAVYLDAYKKADMGGAAAVGAFERFLHERDTSRPFFGFLSIPDTHHPYIVPDPFMDKMDVAQPSLDAILFNFRQIDYLVGNRELKEKDKSDLDKMFDACVAYIDALVGRIIECLQKKNLFDNTLIVFIADHGGNYGQRRNYMGSTNFTYECEICTPFFLVNANRTGGCEYLTSVIDLYPTLLEYSGLGHLIEPCHGKNVLSHNFSGHKGILCDYPMLPEWLQTLGFTSPQEIMLFVHVNRTHITPERKKLIWLSTGKHEYYDLAIDPEEKSNLFSFNNPVALQAIDALRSKYRTYIGDMADHLETYNYNDYGYALCNVPPLASVNPSALKMNIIDMEKSPMALICAE